MQRMTSAYANKTIRRLEEEKEYWVAQEANSSTYTVGINEAPVAPVYDFLETAARIEEIDKKICAIKHALNLNNAIAKIKVGDSEMSVDRILIRMAQLNKRKCVLDGMRKNIPKTREPQHGYGLRNPVPEYKCINYDLGLVKAEYERVSRELMDMQLALDHYNLTVGFDVDI